MSGTDRDNPAARPEDHVHRPPFAMPWEEAAANPWGVRLLDVRSVTLGLSSTTMDPGCATNLLSLGQDDGTSFIGVAPVVDRRVECHLRFPIDRMLPDGALFLPREMEHKWALFHHRGAIICVRSWLRQVFAVARVVAGDGYVDVAEIHGVLTAEDEDPGFTARTLDFLIRSHALGLVYPAPLPPGMDTDAVTASMWCMSAFGNRVQFATPDDIDRRLPERPLRATSLLHLAVARMDVPAIEAQIAAGIPVDLLGADGLAPLHWAADPSIMALLLDRGCPVDVRSDEGATPLMVSVQAQSREEVTLLLDRGADIDARDHRGFTALHRAAEMGQVEMSRLLLERGARPDLAAAGGQTARSLAEKRHEAEVLALLDAWG